MISVTDLSSYIFCPRAVYLKKVIEVEPMPKDVLVRGGITHSVMDNLNKKEEDIVKKLSKININDVNNIYRNEFYKVLIEAINRERMMLRQVGLNKLELFNELWTIFLKESDLRSKSVLGFHKKTGLLGNELWDSLEPKFLTELKLSSEELKLKGIIDRVEIFKDEYIPVEMKTGRMMSNGVWPGHKIQIGSYILLLNEKFRSSYGYVDYLEHGERKRIDLDDGLRNEITGIRDNVLNLLSSSEIPAKVENLNKCGKCQFKEECFKL